MKAVQITTRTMRPKWHWRQPGYTRCSKTGKQRAQVVDPCRAPLATTLARMATPPNGRRTLLQNHTRAFHKTSYTSSTASAPLQGRTDSHHKPTFQHIKTTDRTKSIRNRMHHIKIIQFPDNTLRINNIPSTFNNITLLQFNIKAFQILLIKCQICQTLHQR